MIKRMSHRGDIATTSSDGDVTASIIDCINIARKDIELALPKRWLRTTGTISVSNAGGVNYLLPSDCIEPIHFTFTLTGETTARYLTKVEDEKTFYRVYNPVTSITGIPTHYVDRGVSGAPPVKQIALWPYPDRSITVTVFYYKKWTTEILTVSNIASEIPEIPDELHNTVWKGGLYYFLKMFDDPAQTVAKQDYAEAMRQCTVYENYDLDVDNGFTMGPLSVKKETSGRFFNNW